MTMIDGLWKGLEVVRYGEGTIGEYVLDSGSIQKAVNPCRIYRGFVVAAAPGWVLEYDPAIGQIIPFEILDPPEAITVVCKTTLQRRMVTDFATRLSETTLR